MVDQVPIFCKCPKCGVFHWNVFCTSTRPDGTVVQRKWCKLCGHQWKEWPEDI